jgi:3-oxoacyl-[acyl-carrier-protein] synthase II
MGVISPVGSGVPGFFESLLAGHSGIGLHRETGLPVGVVSEFAPPRSLSRAQLLGMDRVAQFGLAAADEAIRDAGLEADSLRGARTGLYLGTGLGGAASLEQGYRDFFAIPGGRIAPLTVVSAMPNATAAHLSIQHGISGPVLTYSVACASAAVAIGEAFRAIRDGYLDIAVAGGAEAMVTPGSSMPGRPCASWRRPTRNLPSGHAVPFRGTAPGSCWARAPGS